MYRGLSGLVQSPEEPNFFGEAGAPLARSTNGAEAMPPSATRVGSQRSTYLLKRKEQVQLVWRRVDRCCKRCPCAQDLAVPRSTKSLPNDPMICLQRQ